MYKEQIEAIQETKPGIILCNGGVNSKILPTEMVCSDMIESCEVFNDEISTQSKILCYVHPALIDVLYNMYKFYKINDWPIQSERKIDQIGVFYWLSELKAPVHFIGSYDCPIKEKYTSDKRDIYISYLHVENDLSKCIELWSTLYL